MAGTVTERDLALDGFAVRVREAGNPDASPVLCLHGGPGMDASYFFPDPDVWGPGLRSLAERHRVVAYDQRGCGGSGAPAGDQPLALSRHVDDIEAVRMALGLEQPALLGHSFGALLALLYALRHPDGASRLILIGAAPTREFQEGYRQAVETLPAEDRTRLAELQRSPLTDDGLLERFRLALPLYFHRRLSDAEREALLGPLSFRAAVNRALAAGLEGFDLRPALPHVRLPALIVYGESDRVVQPRYVLALRGHLLTARFVAFQESGHFPFLEEPGPFAHVVHYFLRQGERTPAGRPE